MNPGAYASALTEAEQGITDPTGNYQAVWSGGLFEQNYWYQFDVVQRQGYIAPAPFFVNLLDSLSDPRITQYFNSDVSDINSTRLSPNFSQPLVTANENLLIWAEAAYRTSDPGTALIKLNDARAIAASSCSG